MRSVNIADLKNNLSRYLDEVRRGSEVLVKDRNKPIARIVPLTPEGDDEVEFMELIAAGGARLPRTSEPLPDSFWKGLPKSNIDLIALLREDRDAG